MGIFVKGKNKAAFGTRLTCPAIVQVLMEKQNFAGQRSGLMWRTWVLTA